MLSHMRNRGQKVHMTHMTRLAQLSHVRNRGQKVHMTHMTRLAQAGSTFSEFATAPRLRGFHSVNRGVLLALPAVDQSY